MPALAPSSRIALPSREQTTQEAWLALMRTTYKACLLRKDGREIEAAQLLGGELPEMIRKWSSRSGLSAAQCKDRLRSLFARAQEQIELSVLQRPSLIMEVCDRISAHGNPGDESPAPTGATATAVVRSIHLRQRIPIGDVSEMLDAIAEAEACSTSFGRRVAAPIPSRIEASLVCA
jgi:hypothetical protein